MEMEIEMEMEMRVVATVFACQLKSC